MHFTAAPTVTLQQLCDPSAPTMSLMLYATVLSIALWIPFYKHLCLKPYPGIPYNHAAAKRISSDLLDLLAHHKRTKEACSYSFQQWRKLRSPIVRIFPTSVFPRSSSASTICAKRKTLCSAGRKSPTEPRARPPSSSPWPRTPRSFNRRINIKASVTALGG